jgi:hypothetical protein
VSPRQLSAAIREGEGRKGKALFVLALVFVVLWAVALAVVVGAWLGGSIHGGDREDASALVAVFSVCSLFPGLWLLVARRRSRALAAAVVEALERAPERIASVDDGGYLSLPSGDYVRLWTVRLVTGEVLRTRISA